MMPRHKVGERVNILCTALIQNRTSTIKTFLEYICIDTESVNQEKFLYTEQN